MEKNVLSVNEMELEQVNLTEEEKQYVDSLDNNLAGGAGAALWCKCVN